MGFLSKLFNQATVNSENKLLVDMHSHLLPGIDDGSRSMEDSIILIKEFQAMGYQKLITTPHVNSDLYKNTPAIIKGKLAELRTQVAAAGLSIEVEAAAEYYLDEGFLHLLEKQGEVMTFGENYVLFETSYLNQPSQLVETIFKIKSAGYWPVLAHPERYTYLYHDFNQFKVIYDLGISFQINVNSLSGYYSKMAQHYARELVKNNMVQFAGSDCHGLKHIQALQKTQSLKEYRHLLDLQLLNNTLL